MINFMRFLLVLALTIPMPAFAEGFDGFESVGPGKGEKIELIIPQNKINDFRKKLNVSCPECMEVEPVDSPSDIWPILIPKPITEKPKTYKPTVPIPEYNSCVFPEKLKNSLVSLRSLLIDFHKKLKVDTSEMLEKEPQNCDTDKLEYYISGLRTLYNKNK